MRNRRGNAIYYLCVIIIVTFLGCSLEQRHKDLSFFFDGVDKAIFFNDYLSKDSLSKDAIAKRDGLLAKVRPELFTHKPFKERKCEQCHTPDKHLVKPMPQLCYQCHPNFTENNTYVHGPVGSGNCLQCHNQHNARYAKLLIRPGQQVCLFCHSSSLVFNNKVHRDIEDAKCTMCHSPHGGKTRFMIKDAVAGNVNGFIMNTFASKHLTAQLFSYVPGDYITKTEVAIYTEQGVLASSTFTDFTGRFQLKNLHPNQTFIFRFKELAPDFKINILNSDGQVVYVVEKNRKGKYVLDQATYEEIHSKINSGPALSSVGSGAAEGKLTVIDDQANKFPANKISGDQSLGANDFKENVEKSQ